MFPGSCYDPLDSDKARTKAAAETEQQLALLTEILTRISDISGDPAFDSDAMNWIQAECRKASCGREPDADGLPTQGEQYVHAIKTIAVLRVTLREGLRRFKEYEMDVDTEPRRRDHRQFMRRASRLLVDSSSREASNSDV